MSIVLLEHILFQEQVPVLLVLLEHILPLHQPLCVLRVLRAPTKLHKGQLLVMLYQRIHLQVLFQFRLVDMLLTSRWESRLAMRSMVCFVKTLHHSYQSHKTMFNLCLPLLGCKCKYRIHLLPPQTLVQHR